MPRLDLSSKRLLAIPCIPASRRRSSSLPKSSPEAAVTVEDAMGGKLAPASKLSSLLPSFYDNIGGGVSPISSNSDDAPKSSSSTSKAKSTPMNMSDDEFDGITELSETDFAEIKSSTRKRRVTRSSVAASDPIDLSGPSSPPAPRSPRSPRLAQNPASSPTRTRRRRVIVSDSEDELPSSKQDKGKGRARVVLSEEEEHGEPSKRSTSRHSTVDAAADNSDQYDDFDIDFDSVPFPDDGVNIPDFSVFPSTYPKRSPTPEPIVIDDDDDDDEAYTDPLALGIIKPRAATQKVMHFTDLVLLPDIDERLRTFYLEHWRRGADADADDEDPEDNDLVFRGAPVTRPKPRFFKRGRGRGRGRGRR